MGETFVLGGAGDDWNQNVYIILVIDGRIIINRIPQNNNNGIQFYFHPQQNARQKGLGLCAVCLLSQIPAKLAMDPRALPRERVLATVDAYVDAKGPPSPDLS